MGPLLPAGFHNVFSVSARLCGFGAQGLGSKALHRGFKLFGAGRKLFLVARVIRYTTGHRWKLTEPLS